MGGPSGDRIRGTRGRDVIVSLGGNDVVSGLTRRDLVCTGTGNDRVDERDDRDARDFAAFRIDLGAGDDLSHVSGHFDDERGTIIAGAGDDTILLSRHKDALVELGSGDDLIRIAPRRASVITTWLDMCVSFRSATGPVHVNLGRARATGQGRDQLVNIRRVVDSRFDDVLIGTDRNDGIDTGGGLNLVRAGTRNDDVTGGSRADEVYLGPGADSGGRRIWLESVSAPPPAARREAGVRRASACQRLVG